MKFGMRTPSIRKSLSARLSIHRNINNALGLRMPRGWGWLRNPRKAVYNYVYNRTTFSFWGLLRKLLK
ncbi:MAG TPA: hypothetical protein VHB73_03040 [Alphaproteobacteria bacterium]|nr:hypothetical protein [Alphaproteobacteria bacterium]